MKFQFVCNAALSLEHTVVQYDYSYTTNVSIYGFAHERFVFLLKSTHHYYSTRYDTGTIQDDTVPYLSSCTVTHM